MRSRKDFDRNLYGIVKLTRICDYKDKVKPFLEKVESWVDQECIWKYSDDFYESDCGFTFQFSDERDEVNDYGFKYCPKCGCKIKSDESK